MGAKAGFPRGGNTEIKGQIKQRTNRMKQITINNNQYTFFNEVWERGYNWGHRSVLHLNGYKLTEAKVTYYNRTWESYQFQSVMLQAAEDYLDTLLGEAIDNYKRANDIKRLTKERKQIVVSEFRKEHSELYQLIGRL